MVLDGTNVGIVLFTILMMVTANTNEWLVSFEIGLISVKYGTCKLLPIWVLVSTYCSTGFN